MAKSRFPVAHLYPRGTYRAPAFYFRGSESLTEPEYLLRELLIARTNHATSKRELDKELAELEATSATLAQRDDYTVALATAFGEESSATEINANLRRQLAELSAEIESIESHISDCRAQQHTSLVSGLNRERAYYHAEIENLRLDVTNGFRSIQSTKAQVAETVCCADYVEALQRNVELSAMMQLAHHLRGEMNNLFREFNNVKPPKTVVRGNGAEPRVRQIRDLYQQRQVKQVQLDGLQRERYHTETLARCKALGMIDQIEAMNQVLMSLGGEQINVDAIKEELFAAAPETQQKESKAPRSARKVRVGTAAPSRRANTSFV
jgi:allophanate hydrolase subunit 1